MDPVTAAEGIYQLVNNNMAAALGVVSVERGYDPREFVLVVAGGAGPIHAAPIARELEIPLILIPRESSVFCAAGMLISDLKHDYVRTYAKDIDQVDINEVNTVYAEMAKNAREVLVSENVSAGHIEINYSGDLRYVGQFNEVEVALPDTQEFSHEVLQTMCNAFHQRHDALYGYSMQGAEMELINLRVTGRGKTAKPKQDTHPFDSEDAGKAKIGERQAYFEDRFQETPVYDGLKLLNGNKLSGPAIVVQPTTTIVIPPDFSLYCDEYNNYLMYPGKEDVHKLCESLKTVEK